MIKNGKGATAPGSGIHFVLSTFSAYPEFHTILDGIHFVPD